MAIKSDKWIIEQAQENQLITPFSSEQIREVDGEKIVSYGVSSYGYDVRCSNEFKIFTNTHSSIVDPKSFDPKSFVDVTAEECIIPPNSFALARTVEYFKIPRSVLTLCLGKSTYAYVDLPRHKVRTDLGILKYSTVLARANEFGGIMHSSAVTSTKLFGSKLFGSTIEE